MSKESLRLFFDQACTMSLYVLLFFIPISSALIESFFGLSFIFFFGRLVTSKGLFIQLVKREKVVLFFFAALALSLVNCGPFLLIGLHALFLKWGKYIVLYMIISQTLTTAPRIKNALVSLSCGVCVIIVDCFFQLFFHVDAICHRLMTHHSSNVWALTGPFNHNNGLSAYLSCLLIVVLYWVFSKEKKRIRIGASIVFFLGVFILAYAYSRGAWFSFVLAIALLAYFLKRFWFLGLSMAATVILSFKFILMKSLMFKDSGRFELWGIGLNMIKQHPILGNGIGTFMSWFRDYSTTRGISYAHNCFVQLWAEAGIISIAVFFFYIFKTLREGALAFKMSQDNVFPILICAIIAYICSSFFDTNLFSSQLAFLFWALMGVLKGGLYAA